MLVFGAAVVCVAAFVGPAEAGSPIVIQAAAAVTGRHLTDGAGMSVYLFEKDRLAENHRGSHTSGCLGDCLVLWPPVPAGTAAIAGNGVEAQLMGSIRRRDGVLQATYNGWPLYYFAEDFHPGDTNGHQFEEFGGEWYLITPTGRELGGQIASGIAYQGGEECGCHDADPADVAVASKGTSARGRPTTLASMR
jgi:predicted lipoprotein with Yx(FWY)xxD motif